MFGSHSRLRDHAASTTNRTPSTVKEESPARFVEMTILPKSPASGLGECVILLLLGQRSQEHVSLNISGPGLMDLIDDVFDLP